MSITENFISLYKSRVILDSFAFIGSDCQKLLDPASDLIGIGYNGFLWESSIVLGNLDEQLNCSPHDGGASSSYSA